MAEKNNTQMPDVNEQIKNRMDKLKTLQEAETHLRLQSTM